MMKLEEALNKKDLSVFKMEPKKQFAKQIIQYQNFKTNVALEKINRMGISIGTARNYFEYGLKYIKTGEKSRTVCNVIFEYLDYFLAQKIQPLTPREDERRKAKSIILTKEPEIKEQPIPEPQPTQNKENKKLQGVLVDKVDIKIYPTIQECKAYLDAVTRYTGYQVKIVEIGVKDFN